MIDEKLLRGELKQMTKAERILLDPICEALRIHQKATDKKGWWVMPNRIVALAAVKMNKEFEAEVMSRE